MNGSRPTPELQEENACFSITPSFNKIFEMYFETGVGAAFFCMAFVSTFSTLVIYLYAMYKIRQHNPVGTERRRSLTLVFGLFPVFAISSLFGIVIPRATYTVDWAASIYLAITLYSFFGLIMEYFGGAEAMIKYFDVHPVSFAQAPYACCCKCLPDVRLTESQFHFVRYMVLQVTLIRPLCVFLGAVLWSDAVQENSAIQDPNAISFWLGIISGFSTGFAIYGLQIFSRSSQEYLEKFYVRTKFVAVQLVLILTGVVRLVMDILGFTDSIICRGPLRSPERGQIIYNHVTIHIMTICIFGFLIYWIWLSRFSSHRNEVEHPVEVPESPTSTGQFPEMDNKAAETKDV